MQLTNGTKLVADYTMGLRPDGRELLVVVVKGTFLIPRRSAAEPQLAGQQAPLVLADEFSGEPGFSAPVYEADFVPHKPRCDVLLNGSAYAPGGTPVESVTVALRVGSVAKRFNVVGDRQWRKGLLRASATPAQPFDRMPISYDNAFGGVDRTDPDENKHRWYPANHAGKGFHANTAAEHLDGKPLPNTEEIDNPIRSPKGTYMPMAFGPVGRAWGDRPNWAGTYDDHWKDNVFPFLPADFDELYYQSAPPDQQTDYLRGGEKVELHNLTPQGDATFRIPTLAVPVTFYLANDERIEQDAVIDTLIIEPDAGRFLVIWRTALELQRNIFDVAETTVGPMSPAWCRARDLGKTYYASLADLIADKRAEQDDDEGDEDEDEDEEEEEEEGEEAEAGDDDAEADDEASADADEDLIEAAPAADVDIEPGDDDLASDGRSDLQ